MSALQYDFDDLDGALLSKIPQHKRKWVWNYALLEKFFFFQLPQRACFNLIIRTYLQYDTAWMYVFGWKVCGHKTCIIGAVIEAC